MNSIRCIIVDDEPLAQQLVEDYISKVSLVKLQGKFDSAMDAFGFLKNNPIDLIFLDIQMPGINGMEFVNLLDPKIKVIFTTAHSEYAVKSYEKNALDYLLKPIAFDRFLTAINKHPLMENQMESVTMESQDNFIYIKSDSRFVKLFYTDIAFIEGLKDYVVFHTQDCKYIVYHSLKKLETILPIQFLRVHHSYIVNIDQVKMLKDNHLYINEESISVSKKYRDRISELIKQKLI